MKKTYILALIALSSLYFMGCNNTNGATSLQDENVTILYVREKKVPCSGNGLTKCFQTRDTPSKEWEYFYEPIEGFYYEEGYRYKLKVKINKIHYPKDEPIADAPSTRVILIKVLNKTLIENGVKYEY